MSTNVVGPSDATSGRGSSNGRTTKGIKALSADDQPDIEPGEFGFPVQGLPWAMFGNQDPDVMEFYREVKLEDLHRMTQRDGHAKGLLNVLTWPCQAAERRVDPADGVAGGEDEADFIRDMLEKPPHQGGMSTTMSYVLETTCLAFRDGFAVHEKVVEEKDGMLVLRKLAPRPARTCVFRYDDHGGLAGVKQKVWWKGELQEVVMPPEKVLVFTVGKAESPLEGESLFLPAYYHYDKKHRLYYIGHVAAQVGAVPLRVGMLPAGSPKQREMFRRALQQLGLQGAMVVPKDATVDTHQNLSILSDILKFIDHHDVAMSKSILAHFMDIGLSAKSHLGTGTATSELSDLFLVSLESHLKDIADGFNSYLIPYFIDKNFGSGKYPTFAFEPFNDEQKATLKETFGKMFSPTAQPLPEMLFELQRRMADELGLEGIDWDAIEQSFMDEQDMKKQIAEAARKAQLDQIKNPPPPPSPPPGPGGPNAPNAPPTNAPPPPSPPSPIPPVKLTDPTDPTDDILARAIQLAERALLGGQGARGEVVTDSIGEPIVVGDQILMVGHNQPGGDTAVYTVISITGQVLGLRSAAGAQRSALPTQVIRVLPTPNAPPPAPTPAPAP